MAQSGGAAADDQDQSTIGMGEKLTHRLKVLREDLSNKSPSACILALCALIVAAVLIGAIVALFVFSSSALSLPPMKNEMSQATRRIKGWPQMDKIQDLPEDGDMDGEFRGIAMDGLFPANVSTCSGFGFACSNHVNHVIPTNKRCDGVYDCNDKSDEENCHECQSLFSCSSRLGSDSSDDSQGTRKRLGAPKICLTAQQLCDGVQDCPDGSDEKDWCKSECAANEFHCKGQNVCIPASSRCNGIVDCNDGSDEENCESCKGGALECDKTCIEPSKLCDGVTDCSNGADETNCDCKTCSGSDKALCDDGTCILRSAICDGKQDCSNGMDEMDCPGSCAANTEGMAKRERVTCSDGRSYLKSEACSGEFEVCAKSCGGTCDETTAFTCPNDGKCIPRKMVCDGVVDCTGGDDEKDCKCSDDTFKCMTENKCIATSQQCDGVNDCYDLSDEKDCDECPTTAFRCSVDRTCIPASARCNGISECTDGADEANCSCDECVGGHSNTYMCDGSARCMRREDVCNPYATCPNATRVDKAYCANLMIKNKNLYPW